MKHILLIFAVVCLQACSSDNDFAKGKQQLEAQGYTNVVNTGYEAFCCGEDDCFSTGFTAVDSKGNKVEGCFCSSVGKGITIRFE